MRYLNIFSIAALFIFVASVFLSCGEDPTSPREKDVTEGPHLTIADDSFDFGYVPQNSSVSHAFALYSSGSDTVRILSIRPG